MKIIFHENQLCYRGTSNALFDYAKYNEEILGNESIIMFPKNSPNNVQEAIDKFSNKFKVYSYTDNNERNKILEASQADLFYAIKPHSTYLTCLLSAFFFLIYHLRRK